MKPSKNKWKNYLKNESKKNIDEEIPPTIFLKHIDFFLFLEELTKKIRFNILEDSS